jgi:FecR protein
MAGEALMSNSNRAALLNVFGAVAFAAALSIAAIAGPLPARAAGACALVPNGRLPSVMILQCGQTLTVRPTPGTSYQPLYKKGDPLPVGIRLTDGALLIEFHPAKPNEKFQILTPLAIAAVRGTKWAMDVTKDQTSTFVVAGTVAVTNRRLNQFVVLTEGQGVDITPTDTSVVARTWGDERVRALLSRFGE